MTQAIAAETTFLHRPLSSSGGGSIRFTRASDTVSAESTPAAAAAMALSIRGGPARC